ncbi:MAG TPA: hypothetical protein VKZ63_14625 [Kofleriaceae bacterium]|nr:hypothetical protein [Kofleriaceae bacterium]
MRHAVALFVAICLAGAHPAGGAAGPAAGAAARSAGAAARAELHRALAALRADGVGAAAAVLQRRVRQRSPKMKLAPAEAAAIARALLRRLPEMPEARALERLMPRSTVELVRAVEERGLPGAEAERMARYLRGMVRALRPGNLAQLDANHSHVIGRRWHEIDYTGEGTTWQERRAEWSRHGVGDFRSAVHLHRYFTAEESLPYFRRIYRPRGRMSGVPPP